MTKIASVLSIVLIQLLPRFGQRVLRVEGKPAGSRFAHINPFRKRLLLILLAVLPNAAFAAPFLISVSNPSPNVTLDAPGESAFFLNAGVLDINSNGPDAGDIPISLRATLVSISAGDRIQVFRSGDNPVVRAITGSLAAEVRWDVTNRNTGLPIDGDPAFLITDIDGSRGTPIESVSALCAGLTSYTVNGNFVAGVNANSSNLAETNIRITETNGTILAEGTQNQNGGQQEGYMQYNWTGINSWVVNYFATSGGRWYVHDADGDIPFDGTQTDINLVDLATIKREVFSAGRPPRQGETITWEVELSNAGPAPANDANITDILPPEVTFVSATSTGNVGTIDTSNLPNIVWSDVDIPVNGSEILTIVATVNAPQGTPITNRTNTAQAFETKCSSRDQLQSTFIVGEDPAPSLSVQKTAATPTVINGMSATLSDGGDTITYTYVVENTGNTIINNVTPFDVGPSFNGVNGSGSLAAFNPAPLTLTPGQIQTFTAIYTLSQGDVDNLANAADPAMGISNTATATGMPAEGVLAAVVPSTATTGFAITPNASIVKASPSISTGSGASGTVTDAGDVVNYTFTITNTGNVTIDDARPEDPGPTFNGINRAGSLSAFTPINADLAPGDSEVFMASYPLSQIDIDNLAQAPNPLTGIDNSALVQGDPAGAAAIPVIMSNVVETGFAPMPAMTIVKSVSNVGSFDEVGDVINYQWVVNNIGNVTINNVTVSDAGPTFNGQAAGNVLQSISPSNANLAPGTSQTFTASYTLTQSDVDNVSQSATPATAIDNTSTLNGAPVGGTLGSITSNTVETGFTPTESLALSKSVTGPTTGLGANAGATDAGDTLNYSFAVENTGSVTLTSLSITDAGPSFAGTTGTGNLSAISCASTSLVAGQTTTCSAIYTLSQGDIDAALASNGGTNQVTNSATASGNTPNGGTINSPSSAATASIAADSSIVISKTASAPTINLGANPSITDPLDTISYQLRVENTGNTTLSGVTVSDGLSSAVLTCPANTVGGASFVNGSSGLAPNDSVTCTAVYTITQIDINNGQVVNTASVTSTDPTGATIGDSDTETSGFTQRASLSLVKGTVAGDPVPTMAGDFITYEFVLTNTGNVSLSSPQVSDAQCEDPVGPITGTNTFAPLVGDTNSNLILDAGEVWRLQCRYQTILSDINNTEIFNTGTASGVPPAGSNLPTPNSVSTRLVKAQGSTGIDLQKSAGLPTTNLGVLPTVVDAGDTVEYQFTVTNTGTVTLTNLALNDPLLGGAITTCPVTSLNPGVSTICNVTYPLQQSDFDDLTSVGSLENSASVTADPPPTVPVTDSPVANSSAASPIPPSANLSVAKSVSSFPNPLVANAVINYQYEVRNTGNVTIDNVTPVDTGPTFNGVSGTNALTAFSPTPTSLAPDAMQVFMASYTVSQIDIDNMAAAATPATAIDNTATATGTPVVGTLAPVTPSTVETGVAPMPSIALIKTSTPPSAPITVGQTIAYSFSLDNTGNVSIANPIITDPQCQPNSVLSRTNGYVSGDAGTANVLDPDDTWTFTCSYAITQDDIDAGTVQNTAIAMGQDPAGNNVMDTSDSGNAGDDTGAANDPTNTALTRTAAWNVVKDTVSTPSRAGDTLVYTFVVNNTGNVSISGITLNDPKCASGPNFLGGDDDGNSQLTPNESWNYSCSSIAVTQTEVNAGTVNNTVTASGTAAGGLALPDASNTEMTAIAPAPVLSIVKTATAPGVGLGSITTATDAGDLIAYEVAVSNDGNVTIDSIQVNDPGPSFNGVAGTGTLSTFSCATTTLAPLQATTCSASYTLSQLDVDRAIAGGADSVINSATVSGEDPSNGTVTSPSDSDTTSVNNDSEIVVIKTAGTISTAGGADPAITDVGDTISYTLAVTNTGNTTLSNVSVTDSIANVTCPATTQSGAAFSNLTGSLSVADSVICTAIYTIDQDDLNAGGVVNSGNVTADDPSGTEVSGVDEITTPLTQSTSISLSKTATEPAQTPPAVGQTISYTFTLQNTGNVSLTDPQVNDPKCGAIPLSFTNGYQGDNGNSDAILDANETWDFACDYVTEQSDFDLGRVENTATGSGTTPLNSGLPNPMSTANSIADLQQETGLSLIKMAGMPTTSAGALSSDTDVGDTIEFTFEVQNTGNVTLTNVAIDDPLFMSVGGVSCPQTTLVANQMISCTATYTLTQTDINNGMVSNTASITGDPPPAVPPADKPEAMSSAMVGIPGIAQLAVVKTASAIPTAVVAGDTITYSFEVSNTGNVTIDNIEPVDTGPTFNGSAGSNALSGFTTSPNPASLDPGDSQTFTATYVLSQQDLDNFSAAADPSTAIQNSATAIGEPSNGNLLPVTPSTVNTGVNPSPELLLIKTSTAPASPAQAGSDVTYNFALQNTGNVTISNPTVTDTRCQAPGSVLSLTSGYTTGDAGQIGLLDVNETWNFACTYALSQADIDAGTVQNTAVAAGQDPGGNAVTDDSDSGNAGDDTGGGSDPTNTPIARVASLSVDKTTASVPTRAGDTLVYNFEVRNTGNVSVSGVVVNDVKCAAAPNFVGGDADGNSAITPNEVWTYACTSIGVTQPEVDAGAVNNNVSVTGTPPAGTNLAPATDTLSTPVASDPALTLVKTSGTPTIGLGALPAATDAGDTIAYSFAVTNSGNVTLNSLAITDDGTSFNGSAGTGSLGTVNCPVTTLAPNQSTTCTASYTLTQTDVDNAIAGGADSVSNSATAGATPPVGPAISSPQSTATTSITSMPAINVLKTLDTAVTPNPSIAAGDPSITDVGDTLSYVILVTNTGNAPLSNVNVTDSIATVNCPNTAFSDGTGGSLAVGASESCTATFALLQGNLNTGSVVNIGGASGQDSQGTMVSDQDQLTTALTRKTSLVLTKVGTEDFTITAPPADPNPGDTILYEFTLENSGNVSLSGVQIDDPLCGATPLSLTNGFVPTAPGTTGDDGNGLLDADEVWGFACTVTLVGSDIDLGGVDNRAEATGTPPAGSGLMSPIAVAGTQTVLDQRAAISLDKVGGAPTTAAGVLGSATDAGDATNPGDTITYSFTLENEGNVTLSNVTITDPQCANSPLTVISSEFVSGDTGDGAGGPPNGLMEESETWVFRCSYTLTQANVDAGQVPNTATVTAQPPATVPPAPNPSAMSSALVAIPPAASLAVAKSATLPTNFVAGQTITYSFVVNNTGNVTIDDVLPVDAGPTFNGVAAQNALSSSFTPTTPATALPISLAPQSSQTFTAEYILSQSDIDNMAAAADPTMAIDNSATADGNPVNGNLAPVTPSVVETGVAPMPLLELRKRSIPPASIAAGAQLVYEFELENTGNTTISGPLVNDSMCQTPGATLSFASGYVSGDSGVIAQSLDVGETWVFQCQYTLTQLNIDAGTVQNTATGSGQDPSGTTRTDVSDSTNPNDAGSSGPSDPTNTPLTGSPAWNVLKSTADVPAAAGDTLDYSFVITNTGNVSINTVSVVDAKCDPATPPTIDPSTDAAPIGVLSPAGLNGVPAAEAWTYTCTSLPVTQAEMDAGVVINTVNITGSSPNGVLPPDSATVNTPTTQSPAISLVKSAGAATLNDDGSFDQVFDFVLKSVGNVAVNTVSISDDLNAQFGACFDSAVAPGAVALVDVAPANDSSGAVVGSFPVVATATSLGAGDSLTVTGFTARFNPNASGCVFPDPAENSAVADATGPSSPSGPGGPVQDLSDSGTDPDLGTPNGPGVPTPFTPPSNNAEIGLAKSAAILAFNDDFSFDVEYTILMQNTGDVDLNNIELFDDIADQFGAAFVASTATTTSGGIISAPVVSVISDVGSTALVLPSLNPAYDGGAANIFDGSSGILGVGDVLQVVFSIRANPTLLPTLPTQFENTAQGGGVAPDGSAVTDGSNSGSDPTNGSGGASNPTIVTLDDVANLPIVLGQLSSTAIDATTINVQWQTQTEVGNLGFNLYGRVNDRWQRLNPEIIPGQGDSVQIVSYQYTASTSAKIIALSDIDSYGKETLHGPFMLGQTYGKAPQRQATDWTEAIERREAKRQAREQQRREQLKQRGQQRLKQRKQSRAAVGG